MPNPFVFPFSFPINFNAEPAPEVKTPSAPTPWRPLPLHITVDHPDANNIWVFLNGTRVHNFIEVDVLGCVGVRLMYNSWGGVLRDPEGYLYHERVYGNFRLEWAQPDPEPFLDEPYSFSG